METEQPLNERSTRAQRPLEWMRFDPVKYSLLCDGLTFAQVGALTKVMLHLWQRGPMPEADLQRIAKGEFPGIVDLFTPHGDGLSLDMIEEARAYGAGMQSRASAAGKASAVQRSFNRRSTRVKRTLNGSSTDAEQSLNGRSTDVLSMSQSVSPSSSVSVSEMKERARAPEPDPRFEALWLTFDRYGAKGKALHYWHRLPEEDRAAIIAKAPAYVASTPGCAYRKQLEGWINPDNRLWERPIVDRTAADKPKGPMTYAEARAKLEAIRAANGIAPGGYLPTNLIPAEVRDAMQRQTA